MLQKERPLVAIFDEEHTTEHCLPLTFQVDDRCVGIFSLTYKIVTYKVQGSFYYLKDL